jgi:hypothetical protein
MEALKIMIDAVKGVNMENYSKSETSEAIRNALIEMNGGSKKLNLKNFYRGSQLYALVQELIPAIIDEGFKDEDVLFNLVDYRNIADGDEEEFYVEGNSYFLVADAAAGIRGVRRQRIDKSETVTVKTSVKVVRIYEELNRLLAGKVTFDKFVDNVAKSFKQKILADAYKAISEMSQTTAGLDSNYVVAGTGTGDEDALIELIQHVEAATGKEARIYGTKAALRKVTTATVSDEAKKDMYEMGYYGKFNGTEMICMRQVHKVGTSVFALDDSKLYIIAGDDKPVKIVNEGEGLLYEGDATANNDLTQEYVYGQTFGVGVVCAEKMGIFTLA